MYHRPLEPVEEIRTVYEMMYPYGFYNNKPGETCVAIERELRRLCREDTRHILLIIGRYLNIGFTPNTSTSEICGSIQKRIQDICLKIPDIEKSKYLVGSVAGNVDVTELISPLDMNDRIWCKTIIQLLVEEYTDDEGHTDSRIYTYFYRKIGLHNDRLKGYEYLSNRTIRSKRDILNDRGHLRRINKYAVWVGGQRKMKLISIKDAEEIWNDPATANYVFVPDLMIAGNPVTINRSFQGGMGGPRISRNNYTTTMKDLYEREVARIGFFDNKTPNEIFRYDYGPAVGPVRDFFRGVLIAGLSPEQGRVLLKILDMIVADELEIGRYDANGDIIFTNFTDIC